MCYICVVKIEIHPHALIHGLSEEQICAAWETTGIGIGVVRKRDIEADPPRAALVGFDSSGRPIELVAVVGRESILIIHARYLTKGFLREVRNAEGRGRNGSFN